MSKEYDPRMHTAEHVLNGVMMRRYGCGRCFSTHINPKKSKVDFHFPHDLDEAETRAVEAEVNAVLERHLPVTAWPMDREQAARLFNLSRLPENAGDSLRIVYVGGREEEPQWPAQNTGPAPGGPALPEGVADACPCIGEHVANTAECGRFVWVSHEFQPVPEGGGVLRVRFRTE